MLTHLTLRWTRFVVSYPRSVLVFLLFLTALSIFYSVEHFSINSNTEDLINQDTPWKKIHNEWIKAFPHLTHLTLVVISGPQRSSVDTVSEELEDLLKTNNQWYSDVFAPDNLDFLRQHGLLYMDNTALENVTIQLAESQPLLTALKADPNLRGFFGFLQTALESGEVLPETLIPLIEVMTSTISDNRTVSWKDHLLKAETDPELTHYSIIFVKGRADFGETLPNARIIGSIKENISMLNSEQKNNVSIRLTGQTPLDHSEIESAMESAQLAGTVASLLLIIVLVMGVKSLRVIIATYFSMLVGLALTTAYALLTVGQFNTISIIFLVMFIGLGVDFAIHLCLRYQEALASHTKKDAIAFTSGDLGPAIGLCAISSALGFLAYVPTNYTGLAELGIISGGGMFIALAVSFTAIPAFFALTKEPDPLVPMPGVAYFSLSIARQRKTIIGLTIAVTILAAYIARDAFFDYSTLALKDQDSEAMQTFMELQDNGNITAFSISYIANSPEEALKIKNELLRLDAVSDVLIPEDYLPASQDTKLEMLEDAGFLLDSTFYTQRNEVPFTETDRLNKTTDLQHSLEKTLNNPLHTPAVASALRKLKQELSSLTLDTNSVSLLKNYESRLIGDMEEQLNWLENALSVSSLGLKNLPQPLLQRLIKSDGRQLVSILPNGDVRESAFLKEFVTQVRSVAPRATGRPIAELGIGRIVIDSFTKAVLYAVVAIAIVLLFALRSVVDTVLVFIPLILTTLMTAATSVLTNLPVNMANVVVVPLIFGLGVDNGIHVVKRFHQAQTFEELVTSSTPRAVLLSTLTTLGTFGALSLSSHHGIYSIGILLTCALSFQLILTLVVLPAFLSVFSKPRTPVHSRLY